MIKNNLKRLVPGRIQETAHFQKASRFLQIVIPRYVRAKYDKIYSLINYEKYIKKEMKKYDNEFYRQRIEWYIPRATEVFNQEKKHVIDIICDRFDFESILEIACGMGLNSNYFAELGYEVCGVDLSSMAVEYANKTFPNLKGKIICTPAHNLPFEDNSFDLVFSYSFLNHMPTVSVIPTLKEMFRVANKYSIHISGLGKTGFLTSFDHHPTVKPREWWEKRFLSVGFIKIDHQCDFKTKKQVFIFKK